MSDLNVIHPDRFKIEALRRKQARTRAEIAKDKIEEGYGELKAAAGSHAAQEYLRCILLLECTP